MSERPQNGFTLIEVLISLAIFALIAAAGVSLVDSVLGVENQTRGRLERLGELQRAMYALTRDLEQATPGSFVKNGDTLVFSRHSSSLYGPDTRVGYAVENASLRRAIDPGSPNGRSHVLLSGVSSIQWTFYYPGQGWKADLPVIEPAPQPGALAIGVVQAPPQPTAIAADILLEAGDRAAGGALRRLVELPAMPPAAP